jgi:hypothetical protein
MLFRGKKNLVNGTLGVVFVTTLTGKTLAANVPELTNANVNERNKCP